jgi:hypothetical protein
MFQSLKKHCKLYKSYNDYKGLLAVKNCHGTFANVHGTFVKTVLNEENDFIEIL